MYKALEAFQTKCAWKLGQSWRVDWLDEEELGGRPAVDVPGDVASSRLGSGAECRTCGLVE